jgi:predicted ATPase
MTNAAAPPPLPTHLTPLLGRVDFLRLIASERIDAEWRLLTVAGPGGVGKGRLAVAAAEALAALGSPHTNIATSSALAPRTARRPRLAKRPSRSMMQRHVRPGRKGRR